MPQAVHSRLAQSDPFLGTADEGRRPKPHLIPEALGKEIGDSFFLRRQGMPPMAAFLKEWIQCWLEKYHVISPAGGETCPTLVEVWLATGPWPPLRHRQDDRDKEHMTPSAPWSCGTKTTHHLPQSLLAPGHSLPLSFPSSKSPSSLTYQLSPRKPVFGAIRFFFARVFFLKKR